MEAVEKVIEDFEVIANWAKSCKTLDQLNTVEKFLANKVSLLSKTNFTNKSIRALNYHLGVLDGIILAIRKIKFN